MKRKILSAMVLLLVFSITIAVHAASITYTYDNLNRLTKIDYGNGITEGYTYDDIGNRETLVITEQDSDGDGLADHLEDTMCTDPYDADTDDDGISDGDEDANHNGEVDPGETHPCNIDTDGDGIQDGTELGYTLADIGPDTDTGIFQPDLDPSITTDPLNPDTDGDGLTDGQEDVNHNGMVDEGERDPDARDNEFNLDSAKITNAYMPMQVGGKLTYTGTGTWEEYGRYSKAVDTEVVDTVDCLKILVKGHGNDPDPEEDPEWYYIWVAEDTDYVVWLLQIYDAQSDETTTFGKDGAVLWMPANPIIGQTFRQIGTEYCEIMETGVTVPQLGTGIGPYTDCLKVEWTDGGPDVDIYYLAPDVGSVKEEWDNAGETNGWELQGVANGNTLVVDFGSLGLWQYNGTWTKLSDADVEYLGLYSDKLVADLGSLGLWEYNGTSLSQLTSADADNTGNCMIAPLLGSD